MEEEIGQQLIILGVEVVIVIFGFMFLFFILTSPLQQLLCFLQQLENVIYILRLV